MSDFPPSVRKVFDAFSKSGEQIYLVGGAVRNGLWGIAQKDYDFATPAPPELIQQILQSHHIDFVNTGLEHGTMTAIIDHIPMEITSFRKDIQTNGRHALTEFGQNMADDARRRDFTINALYQAENGQIIDPLNGKNDIIHRRLNFIGDAKARIAEDYLRILRYVRFYAEYDLARNPHDERAIVNRVAALSQLSAERIGQEMKKILAAPHSGKAIILAEKLGIFGVICKNFHKNSYLTWDKYRIENIENHARLPLYKKDWRVELLSGLERLEDIPQRSWALSHADTRFMLKLWEATYLNLSPLALGYYYGDEIGFWALYRKASFLKNHSIHEQDFDDIIRGAQAKFPLSGHDLMKIGFMGEAIGTEKDKLIEDWLKSDLSWGFEKLIAQAQSDFNKKFFNNSIK